MTHPSDPKGRAAAEWASVLALSPFVISARLTQMWMSAGHPTRSDRQEAERMVSEKYLAMSESIVAMNVAFVEASMAASVAAMTGQVRNVDDADAILAAGLRPYTSRLKANRQRLGRKA